MIGMCPDVVIHNTQFISCFSFSHVFWVDASSLESIKISLKAISSIPIAQTSGMHGSVESVLQGISHIQEEWLIVFDNADDPSPEVVAKFIPPGNRGNILITSRNRSMGRVISFENMFEINEMEESDAIALLLNASHLASLPEHQEAATKIVTELGCVPLAVDQAGAYIEAGKCDINEYLRRLSLHRKTLMSDNAYKGASEYDKTVYGTWELSFKEIEKRAEGQSSAGHAQAAQAAILILQICAFYHHGDISKKIFQSAAEESAKYTADSDSKVDVNLPLAITSLDHTLLAIGTDGQWDDMTFSEGISVLLSFSLVKRGQSSEMLSVHPLVHCWSRERMSKAEQQQMCEIGSLILSCAITLGDTSQDYAFRRLLFPHIKANELHGNQIGLIRQYYDDKWDNFSKVLKENGDWNRAEQLEVQVMDMRKELLGEEHPDTITSIGNLANIYSDQGKWNEAEQLKVHVMGMSKKLLGEEHPDTLIYMENLAITYGDQGRWNEAEQLIVEVMDMRKKLLGEEHPDTLSSMANIAGTYSKQGRWNEAEQLDLHVMDMRKKLLGEEHPDTIRSMANLARTYSDQGRWNEAEQLDVQVMDMRMKLLDAEHPDILRSMADLASTYSGQGRWNEAEKLQVQVMDMSKKLLGAGHPDTLIDMGNLASTYSGQGRWNEAEQMMVQVKNMMMKLFSADHPDTLTSMANLARIYSHQGRWNEAEQLDVHVMDMRKKLHGEEHPDTLTSMENIARTYSDQGRWNEAEQLDVHVMDMRKKLLGEEHPDTIRSVANLARTYSDQGRWNEAKHLWVQVMEMRKKLLELRLSSQLEQ